MSSAIIDGIKVNYIVKGEGLPLIMLAPGGFDSTIDSWEKRGVWQSLRPLDALTKTFRMIAYDRREAGTSGGRIEQLMAIKHPSFIMAGDDASHSTSSAHQLRELIPGSVLSPLMPPQQNAETVQRWILDSVAAGEKMRTNA